MGIGDGGGNRTPGQLQGGIPRVPGKRRVLRAGQVVGHHTFDFARAFIAGSIRQSTALEFLAPPVDQGLLRQDSLGVSAMGRGGFTARLAGQRLQGTQQGLHDLGFRPDLEPGRTGRPSGVAPKGMLGGWWNIPGRSIGQLDVEGGGKRTAGLQLQPGDRVDFVGERGDAQVPNTQGLKHQLFGRVLVNEPSLFGVDFGPVFRSTTIHLGEQFVSPGEAFGIGQAPRQGDDFLLHVQRGLILVANPFQGLCRELNESVCIARDVGALVGLCVIHPVQVTTGPLRYRADRNASFGFQVFGQAVGKETKVIRGACATMVMHREVGQHPERLAFRRLNGDHRELIVNWGGWPDIALVLVTRVHHGPDGPVAEGVELHAVRSGNPAAAMGESGSPDLVPSDAGGFKLGVRLPDALGNLRREEFRVGGVGHGPETVIHHARGAVGVGRGNENPVDGYSGGLRG